MGFDHNVSVDASVLRVSHGATWWTSVIPTPPFHRLPVYRAPRFSLLLLSPPLLLSFSFHPLLVRQPQPVPFVIVSRSAMSLPTERLIDRGPNLRRKPISADTVNTTLAATVTALQAGGDLVDLAPIPGLSVAVGLLTEILKKVQVSISSSSSGR